MEEGALKCKIFGEAVAAATPPQIRSTLTKVRLRRCNSIYLKELENNQACSNIIGVWVYGYPTQVHLREWSSKGSSNIR